MSFSSSFTYSSTLGFIHDPKILALGMAEVVKNVAHENLAGTEYTSQVTGYKCRSLLLLLGRARGFFWGDLKFFGRGQGGKRRVVFFSPFIKKGSIVLWIFL